MVVTRVLTDPRISTNDKGIPLSDREIARLCRVSHTFVAAVRSTLTGIVASEDAAAQRSRVVAVVGP
jgi:hypothetical protein